MKENKYDDPLFFQKYSEMSRSRLGLAGAGEWLALQSPAGFHKPACTGSGLRLWLALCLCG